jgi:HlyD family secretion protein
MSKQKQSIWVVLSIGLVATLSAVFFFKKNTVTTEYRTAVVERGEITTTVNATGTVSAVTTVDVGSQVSGRIAALYADFNSVVKKGQIIAQLDSTFLSAQVQAALANEEKAEAVVREDQRNLDRTQKLFQTNLASEADRDAVLAAYESDVAGEKQTQAALESAKTNLRYSTIRSPIDGIVISRSVDVGQTVAASLQAPTLFTIANDLRQMMIETSIDEADIGNIQNGQKATFTVDAFPDRPFTGTVTQIRLVPIIAQNVVTYNVIIAADNPDLKLMPGMTANVAIVVSHQENVLKIPNAALRFRPSMIPGETGRAMSLTAVARPTASIRASDGAAFSSDKLNPGTAPSATVWILSPQGKPEPASIRTGITDGSFSAVAGGDLREGQQVIIGMNAQPLTLMSSPRLPGIGGR